MILFRFALWLNSSTKEKRMAVKRHKTTIKRPELHFKST